jgi:hypothetical protein
MNATFDQARVELDHALFVLEPGQSFRVEDAVRVIVTGLGPSLARTSHAAMERPAAWRRTLAPRIFASAAAGTTAS